MRTVFPGAATLAKLPAHHATLPLLLHVSRRAADDLARAQRLGRRHRPRLPARGRASRPGRRALQQQGLRLRVGLRLAEQALPARGQHEVRRQHRGVCDDGVKQSGDAIASSRPARERGPREVVREHVWRGSPAWRRASAPAWHRPTPWPKPLPEKTNVSPVLRDREQRAAQGLRTPNARVSTSRKTSPRTTNVRAAAERHGLRAAGLVACRRCRCACSVASDTRARIRIERVAQRPRDASNVHVMCEPRAGSIVGGARQIR